jgi:hypothetical protein
MALLLIGTGAASIVFSRVQTTWTRLLFASPTPLHSGVFFLHATPKAHFAAQRVSS